MSTGDQPLPGGMQQAPLVDKALSERVIKLYEEVEATLEDLDIPDEEREEIEQNLMEAIAADLLVRLGDKLGEDEKDDLVRLGESSDGQPDLAEVAGFFKDKFSQEELVTGLAEATESVLSEFTEAMQR